MTARKRTLRIAPDLKLPLEAVTETFAILAKRGGGKSYLAAVMVEEMIAAGLVCCVLDPMGNWWGLRSSADGGPGLEVAIIGGAHGDVPLEASAGRVIADLVVEERVPCVVDVSELSKKERKRFVADFAERLYQRNREPLHLVLEEADLFAPQRPQRGEERMLGAVEDLVRRGRGRGIGITLITQRSAVLHKDVLTQTECLVALRTTSPHDRKAIEAWIDVHGSKEERDVVMSSLPKLPIGTAWFWSPGWLEILQRVEVRKRRTFDSTSTPKAGQSASAPKKLAEIDLEALTVRMAETIERAKADDPAELHKRIKALEREIRDSSKPSEPVVERVEVPTVPEGLQEILEDAEKTLARLGADLSVVGDVLSQTRGRVARIPTRLESGSRHPDHARDPRRAGGRARRPDSRGRATSSHRDSPRPSEAGELTRPQQVVLDALAWLERVGQAPARREAVALVAGYSATSGGFANLLGSLRTAELIDYPTAGYVTLTSAGHELATPVDIIDEDNLRETVYARVGGPKTKILRVLVDTYPDVVSREELAEQTGYSATSGGFANLLGSLRTVGLIDYPSRGFVVATDALFLEPRS